MGKILVIAEKPSVGSDIAKALNCTERKDGYIEGSNYVVTWAVGHLIGIKYPEEHKEEYKAWSLDTLPFQFPLSESLKVLPDTKRQFQVIKQLIARDDIDSLVNAGDAGREGLLIQEWIYRMAGNKKPVQMLWISSFTEEAVRKAFDNGLKNRKDFIGLLNEAEARAEGDHFLGINYSRLLTLTRAGEGTSLSYGRCQTPLLNIVVQREYEICKFTSTPYYNIEIEYQDGFKGILVDADNKRIDFKDKHEAERIFQTLSESGRVIRSNKEDKSRKAPLLYNLAALQKTMGSRYGYTPDKTLEIAQRLYEKHKILSYPRTDSQCLSSDLFYVIGEHLESCNFGKFKPFLEKVCKDSIKPEKRYFNDLKVTDHHALIPTINRDMESIYNNLSEEERNVFDAVVSSFIAIFHPDYLYSVTEMVIDVAGSLFYSKGTTVRSYGYKEVLKMEPGEMEVNEEDQKIPYLQEQETVELKGKQIQEKMTKPPARYTVSSLIAVMEKYNIGTSATRAEIIKKLQNPKREFVHLEKGKYYATELGRNFIEIIPEELKDVRLTDNFENKLKQINEGELSKERFLEELKEEFELNFKKFTSAGEKEKLNAPSASAEIKCPKCKTGKIRAGEKNYYCTAYKEGCDFKLWKLVAGKKLTDKNVADLLTKGRTGKISGFKSKAGKAFSAYLVLNEECEIEFKFS